mmetsp:Transcript_9999/g.15145  ORF Transcript_9999/g.15145 Transcript_9999/m.15145 type:complete len:98 (-) Transcript_9999:744-1037(-)
MHLRKGTASPTKIKLKDSVIEQREKGYQAQINLQKALAKRGHNSTTVGNLGSIHSRLPNTSSLIDLRKVPNTIAHQQPAMRSSAENLKLDTMPLPDI